MEPKITSLTQCLLDILKDNNKYYSSEQNKLLLGNIFAAVNNHDSDLMEILYSNELIRKNFFVKVKDIWIFNDKKFIDFISLKDFMPDSFTSFKNRIGLVDKNGHFLDENNDVVLSFPYKDCVLVGNQDKDDQKRSEVMLNETLGLDDINRLLDPKVLVNAKRYSSQGIEQNISFNEKDNLIIKGNNLIALSSILKRYEGKVKCIYIDPPYNRKDGSFQYNDKFNHSTWLVFMKNRLELAKKLLRDDGVIFISRDEHERSYLKVLSDGVFGRDNFIADFIRKTKSTTNDAKTGINIQRDNCLSYAKNRKSINLIGGEKIYQNIRIKTMILMVRLISDNPSAKSGNKENNYFAIRNPYTGKEDYPPNGRYWIFSKNTIEKHIASGRICFKKEYNENQRGFIYKTRLSDLKTKGNTFNSLWFASNEYMNQVATKDAKELGFVDEFKYPKPESFIYYLILHSTEVDDIVLDFFLGSGTTAAVAHKMRRQYIGIEQMDYIENITVSRLNKVIKGEQTGESILADWTGGGSFVYCELAQNTQKWVDLVKKATNNDILDVKNQILNSNDIIPYLSKAEIEFNLSTFDSLSLDEKKLVLFQ
ncbi:DNA methyltransferase [Mycoplasmopsis cynos]|uniref:DNA methyltransferase n=1 Tax=Mycoplasmopsis cynos TaxID=171284 RepID=UPI0024CCF9F6|nr:site-specific DNA-methyltransferase [Mycoplasmopsis cynos]WAM08557.1 site-specific DNA-methyltransferase [Mycoplasmopsis cynos]